ncbi:MAG: hypothetical protein FWG83_03905 [Oscillospiraceae bacterium]|nr:hypothetical protein [Oscillospiraceae bacterium]
MEIKKINSNALNAYKLNNNAAQKVTQNASDRVKNVRKNADSAGAGKFDSVQFDFAATLDVVKANIVSKLNGETDMRELDSLREKYAGGTVPVSVEEIVGNILGD